MGPTLQPLFSCLPLVLAQIEAAIAPARLARFSSATAGDKHFALRLYLWNARLCQEFYFPLQTAEVLIRNAIASRVTSRFGEDWHDSPAFRAILVEKYADELCWLVAEEKRERGGAFSVDHVVSGLSFGFWVSLLTSRYAAHLWANGIHCAFASAPASLGRDEAHQKIDRLRDFRNKVAHHYAIFDRKPAKHIARIEEVVGWISPECLWLIRQTANVPAVINQRPRE